MKIPLKHFNDYIDEIIVARGFLYHKNGHVNGPEEKSPGQYEAMVEGTEEYTVHVSIENGLITSCSCNCPYDMGPICKHEVAVFYQLLQDEFGSINKKTVTRLSRMNNTQKRKSIAEQVNDLLEKVTHEELKQFVRERTSQDTALRNSFLSIFAQYNPHESKTLYVQQVKSILRSASDRHGYIDWRAAAHVGRGVSDLLDSAQNQVKNHNPKSAIYICMAVLEQMTGALQYVDDSNGDIGTNIDFAFALLHDIAKGNPCEEIRKLLIDYCFTAFEGQVYAGWDWHLGMLQIASLLIKNDMETERILSLLDTAKRSEYEQKEAQTIKYDILLKFHGEIAAEQFLEENITNPNLRRIAIQNALEKKNYNKAKSLAHDGIEYDMKDKPGLAMDWYNWLLKTAQAQKDTENIIEYARYLLIDNFSREQDYYQILKKHVKANEWKIFIEKVIDDINTKSRWRSTGLIPQIYINEKWWDRLLEFVKEKPSLDRIEQYEKYLAKPYRDEIIEMYAKAVVIYIEGNISRDHYQTACRYLQRMNRLGAKEKVNSMIAQLRKEYPRRPALLDELQKTSDKISRFI